LLGPVQASATVFIYSYHYRSAVKYLRYLSVDVSYLENLFAADLLLEDDEVIEKLKEDYFFFGVARGDFLRKLPG